MEETQKQIKVRLFNNEPPLIIAADGMFAMYVFDYIQEMLDMGVGVRCSADGFAFDKGGAIIIKNWIKNYTAGHPETKAIMEKIITALTTAIRNDITVEIIL